VTSRDFVYWLQGYFEIMDPSGTTSFPLGPVQTECIRKHLALVFTHEIDPSMGTKAQQSVLDGIHNQDFSRLQARC
jgi:hypothetical protein